MLFPQTNLSFWIWFLPGWVGKFKTCLSGVGWLQSYVKGEGHVFPAEYTWLFQVWGRNISIPEKNNAFRMEILDTSGSNSTSHQASFKMPIQPRQGSNSPPPGSLLCQIVYSPGTEDSQIPVGYPGVLGEGAGGWWSFESIYGRITARILMSWNGKVV